MGKLITTAYTDYPDQVVRKVTLLSYDNNKYAHVRFDDGREEQIKTGYIWADPQKTRRIAEVHWHVLGGGSRRTFKRRQRKTTYRLYVLGHYGPEQYEFEDQVFDTQAGAVGVALRNAREIHAEIGVCASTVTRLSSSFNHKEIVCRPDGLAYLFPRRNNAQVKYLRGCGKHRSAFR